MIKIITSIFLFFISFLGFFKSQKAENQTITICNTSNESAPAGILLNGEFTNSPIENDSNITYTLPSLTKNNKGEVVLYWTEKDPQNVVSLCFATSIDGKTYSKKKTVFADSGLGNGRLMRPKLLFKKNGEMVAVFSFRTTSVMPPMEARRTPKPESNHDNDGASAPKTVPKGRTKRSSEMRFTVSKDGGNSWTSPTSVDTDTTKLTRGFFDAVLLANDEIAVAYLKDVKGSTKHEERDLRLAITKNGVFQPEKLIDAVVCDCCNISMVVDDSGVLHVVYRDNENNIRDMSHVVSKDNGASFSSPKTLFADNWEINGCPHAGATTVSVKNQQYATWFSGTQNGESGFRLVNSSGNLLKVLDSSAKNPSLASDNKKAVWVWEQTDEKGVNNVFYSKIIDGKLHDSQQVTGSEAGQNASVALFIGKILVADEVLNASKKTILNVQIVE